MLAAQDDVFDELFPGAGRSDDTVVEAQSGSAVDPDAIVLKIAATEPITHEIIAYEAIHRERHEQYQAAARAARMREALAAKHRSKVQAHGSGNPAPHDHNLYSGGAAGLMSLAARAFAAPNTVSTVAATRCDALNPLSRFGRVDDTVRLHYHSIRNGYHGGVAEVLQLRKPSVANQYLPTSVLPSFFTYSSIYFVASDFSFSLNDRAIPGLLTPEPTQLLFSRRFI